MSKNKIQWTLSAASIELGVSRETLRSRIRAAGLPTQSHYATRDLVTAMVGGDIKAERLRVVRGMADRIERENRIKAGETILKVDVTFAINRGIAQLFNSLNQTFLNQFPAQLAGLDELQIYRKMEAALRQLEEQTRQELETMSKEKV